MKNYTLLLIEDNEGDIILTKEALETSIYINKIDVVRDGLAAVDYFKNKITHKPEELPDIVFLDINLPKMNGQEVLQYIKTNEVIQHIPVIVLTTSSSEKDVTASYKNHANCFITKPVEVDSFMDVISKIESFWFTTITSPIKK